MADNSPAKEASDPPGSPPDTQAFPWLLRQKITLPDPVKGHTHRPQLVERAMPTRRRLTVLKAPAGFGKTTLLAECGRRLRQEGVPVAWVSLDERDEPAVLETYIALACAQAGLNRNASSGKEPANGPDSRMGAMAQEIESLGKPFVIAFDQVERLKHPVAFALVAFLLQRGPSNLHLAIACRDIPDGLNLADVLLEGRAEVLDTEDLRFSAAETARFFGMRLSRRALAEEMDHSAGWPFALRISLINRGRGAGRRQGVAQEFVGNWIESHLLADLGGDDRDFVLDLGLFDWIDSALLDEVLQRAGSVRRIESMAVLAGLIEQVRDGATRIWRLHPLLRRHCAQQRLREAPERSDALHRRIAIALARRGQIVQAMGHAVEGGDSFLAGTLLEQAGGVRLWVRQGVTQLQAAHRLLSEEVIAQSPRLQLLRSAALALSGNPHEARVLYRDCAPKLHDGEYADIERLVDDCLVRGCFALYAGEPVGVDWTQDLSRDMARLGRSPEIDALTRGYLEYAFAVLHFLRGEFEPALERLALSSDWLAGTQYLAVYGELLRGQIEFMRGRPSVAESHLRRSGRIARTHLSLDPVAMTSNRVAAKEMDLECNPTATPAELPGLRRALLNFGVPFSFFATGINVLIDMKLQSATVSQALAVADEVLGYQRRAGLAAFVRLLAALRISLLVRDGRIEDADRAYRREALPEAPADCVDLATQSLREMEAVSEARVRLLIARQRFGDARSLLRKLRSVAEGRRLGRVAMRALALSITMECQAGETEAAIRHLEEYLGLFADSPFAWPLVRERTICAELVERFLALRPDSPHRPAARSLLATMRRMDDGSNLALSEREREVLALLPGRRIKQVATTLGLSIHGVRYHLRKLFAKLGASNRSELLQRAAELGLSEDSP